MSNVIEKKQLKYLQRYYLDSIKKTNNKLSSVRQKKNLLKEELRSIQNKNDTITFLKKNKIKEITIYADDQNKYIIECFIKLSFNDYNKIKDIVSNQLTGLNSNLNITENKIIEILNLVYLENGLTFSEFEKIFNLN